MWNTDTKGIFMTYKTELHLHSAEGSACATATAEDIVKVYLEAGYTTVVLTNHFSPHTFKNLGPMTPEEKVEYYIDAYHALKKAADGKLHVLFGMELLRTCDYLIYGMTEEFLRAHTDLMDTSLLISAPIIREAGMILAQAHPFRNDMKVTDPTILDGFEAYNAHTAPFRNKIADQWADEFGLIKTAGSDYHRDTHKAESGIITDFPITSNEELLATLRSGNYKLLNKGEIIELN